MMLPKLPDQPISFHGLHGKNPYRRWCRVIAFRPPKKGEWYLSGAIVEAYQALNDLSTSYWIVEPIEEKPPEVLHEYPTNT